MKTMMTSDEQCSRRMGRSYPQVDEDLGKRAVLRRSEVFDGREADGHIRGNAEKKGVCIWPCSDLRRRERTRGIHKGVDNKETSSSCP